MEREIKFRGISNIFPKVWCYGSLKIALKGALNEYVIFTPFAYDYDPTTTGFNAYSVKKETVGQFTGLLDKNGKEIYEGDIISIDLEDATKQGVVKFDPLRGIWEPYLEGPNEYWYTFQQLATDYGAYVTIIGNIYETPDLLTKAKT